MEQNFTGLIYITKKVFIYYYNLYWLVSFIESILSGTLIKSRKNNYIIIKHNTKSFSGKSKSLVQLINWSNSKHWNIIRSVDQSIRLVFYFSVLLHFQVSQKCILAGHKNIEFGFSFQIDNQKPSNETQNCKSLLNFQLIILILTPTVNNTFQFDSMNTR